MSDIAIVCQGASCACKHGSTSDSLKVISTHKEYVNEIEGSTKMIATTMDIGVPFEAGNFGNCKLQSSSCTPSIVEWKDFYEKVTLSNQGQILTEKSKAVCAIAGTPCVEITFHGQTATPTKGLVDQTDEETHSQLNPLAKPKEEPYRESKIKAYIQRV